MRVWSRVAPGLLVLLSVRAFANASTLLGANGAGFGPDHLPAVRDRDDPLVDAAPRVPGLVVDLTYAKAANLAGRALYRAGTPCRLRRSVTGRLREVALELKARKLRLVAWDCFRPTEVQAELWRARPIPGQVADPNRGSLHERGVAVDLGLADEAGAPVPLPTAHDEFGPQTPADAALPEGEARTHRDLLIAALHAHGFRVNPKEWWHFSRLWGWRWPVAHR